jgi:hypothetical protein
VHDGLAALDLATATPSEEKPDAPIGLPKFDAARVYVCCALSIFEYVESLETHVTAKLIA